MRDKNTSQDKDQKEMFYKKTPKKTNNRRYFIIFSSLLVISIASFIGVFLFSRTTDGGISTMPNPQPGITASPPPSVDPGPIKLLGRLVTASLDLSVEGVEISERWGVGGVCYAGAFHSARGVVEASVDLQNFSTENVVYDEVQNIFIVTIPEPIINCIIDASTLRQERNWGETPACVTDWNGIRSKASDEIINLFREESIDQGILQLAAEQVELKLSSVITNMTNIPVDILFVETEATRDANRVCAPLTDERG